MCLLIKKINEVKKSKGESIIACYSKKKEDYATYSPFFKKIYEEKNTIIFNSEENILFFKNLLNYRYRLRKNRVYDKYIYEAIEDVPICSIKKGDLLYKFSETLYGVYRKVGKIDIDYIGDYYIESNKKSFKDIRYKSKSGKLKLLNLEL